MAEATPSLKRHAPDETPLRFPNKVNPHLKKKAGKKVYAVKSEKNAAEHENANRMKNERHARANQNEME